MELEPGFYKIIERGIFKRYHYLHIYYQGKQKYYKLDHAAGCKCDDNGVMHLEDMQFGKKLRRPLNIQKVMITLEWTDEDDDEFSISFRDIQMFRSIFEDFPEIGKACGANRRRR